MGTCKYCGQKAGWFSSVHEECEAKHENALKEFGKITKAYFLRQCSVSDVMSSRSICTRDGFLSEDDICKLSDPEIRSYTQSVHRPFSPQSLQLVVEYLGAVNVSYDKIHATGAVTEFVQKLLRGFMADYFTDALTLQVAHQRCKKVLDKLPLTAAEVQDAYLYVLNKAAVNFMKDGSLSDAEQRKIDDYITFLQLPISNLPAKYQSGEISKLGQMSILKNLQSGNVPSCSIPCPIILGRGEVLLWSYNDVVMYQEKTERQYRGRRSGWSFRVMKGVTYHTGGTNLKPIENTYMENKGMGTLFITNKHIIFQGTTAAVKVPYTKLIGVTPYTDGIEVHRDGANMKRLAIQGFDPWFVMNVISSVANMKK